MGNASQKKNYICSMFIRKKRNKNNRRQFKLFQNFQFSIINCFVLFNTVLRHAIKKKHTSVKNF
jgi:hypothetical protein